MQIELDKIKKHLNIDADFTDDDSYLLAISDVAQEIVQKHIDCTFDEIAKSEGAIPAPLLQAVLLMIGNLYNNRESVAFTTAVEIPHSYDYLLSLYKHYNNYESGTIKRENPDT